MRAALMETPRADPTLYARMDDLAGKLDGFQTRLFGDRIRGSLNEPGVPGISGRLGTARGLWDTRMTPTATMRRELEIAGTDFAGLENELAAFLDVDLMSLEEELAAAGAPWTPGQRLRGSGGG